MGATKRAGELIVRMLAERHPDTLFASVRFGNVLGSQGSVIPVFKNQIENGGPVVITHPEMTRYFMLIEEAVQLLLQAAIMLDEKGFEEHDSLNTFVLEMGEPVSIIELAQRMIDFYWEDQSRSIGVEFSGLRPGEKLDERLVYAYEQTAGTRHPMIKRVCAKPGVSVNGHGEVFQHSLGELVELAQDHSDGQTIMAALMNCVPEYAPADKASLEKPVVLV
jgi:FlaA1/EpsC-like NDP-sugar epimerase